jgi:hypothetical protein
MLDKGEPFVNANTEWRKEGSPLLFATCDTWINIIYPYNMNEKIYLLLDRGAEVRVRDGYGWNCLHQIFISLRFRNDVVSPCWVQIKDALMCLVTAGADVYACDISGRSVSETACEAACEELWIEVLAECGYDPDPIIQRLDHHYHRENAGLGTFATIFPEIRSTRLSFAEYRKRRRPLLIRSPEEWVEDLKAYVKRVSEWREFLKLIEEHDDNCDGEADIYSTEYGAEWWL